MHLTFVHLGCEINLKGKDRHVQLGFGFELFMILFSVTRLRCGNNLFVIKADLFCMRNNQG